MERRLSIQEVRQQLPSLVQAAFYRGDRAIIARHGKPMAALISIDEYERWKRYREQAFAVFRQVWEANRTAEPAQVERDVAEAVQEVRQTKRVRR